MDWHESGGIYLEIFSLDEAILGSGMEVVYLLFFLEGDVNNESFSFLE